MENRIRGIEVAEICPWLGRLVEYQDACRVVAKAELDRRAEHAGRGKPEERLRFDASVAQARSGDRIRYTVVGGDIPRTGNDVGHTIAGCDRGDLVLRRARKRPESSDLGHHYTLEVDILQLDALNLRAGKGQAFAEHS